MIVVQREEIIDDTFYYIAYHPELSNTISQGGTPEEAEENLIEATELTLTHLKTNNLFIPEPISLDNFAYGFPYTCAIRGNFL